MEWKKIASMEYGKIVFHSIPYHALIIGTTDARASRVPLFLLGHFLTNDCEVLEFCLYITKERFDLGT